MFTQFNAEVADFVVLIACLIAATALLVQLFVRPQISLRMRFAYVLHLLNVKRHLRNWLGIAELEGKVNNDEDDCSDCSDCGCCDTPDCDSCDAPEEFDRVYDRIYVLENKIKENNDNLNARVFNVEDQFGEKLYDYGNRLDAVEQDLGITKTGMMKLVDETFRINEERTEIVRKLGVHNAQIEKGRVDFEAFSEVVDVAHNVLTKEIKRLDKKSPAKKIPAEIRAKLSKAHKAKKTKKARK